MCGARLSTLELERSRAHRIGETEETEAEARILLFERRSVVELREELGLVISRRRALALCLARRMHRARRQQHCTSTFQSLGATLTWF